MKHYLDLVPISAKIHKKQSRMSIFCIVLAVFLVTTIFGMADMFIRSQILQAQQESGNWHIAIKNISNEEAAIIASRPDIEVFSPYGVLNYRGDLGYTLGGKDVAICGCDESYITEIWTDQLEEGVFPQTSNEALVTENAKQIMGVAIGDSIAVETPDGDKLNFTISGFMNNTASIMSGDSYGIILNTEDYCAIYPNVSDGEPNDYSIMFFTQFANTRNIQGKIADLKEQCNLSNEQISSNNNLLGLLGQSRVPFLLQVYLAAAVLFVLVMLAGIMMIASSLNSNVAQRTEFFGLMRCIGATPKQVMRLVRKEALSWCRLAIPVGISIGIVVIWVLCAILRFLSPEFFKAMPTFGFSVPSILAGIVVGLVTVLFAAYSPAKKAAKATADTVKATAKATVATVKAIIAGTKALVAAIAAGGWIAVLIIMIVVLFGAAVAMFGGGSDSNSYTPVSAEVEAYEPIIQKYAKEYGIPEYVELIKAVMMQESGGRGLDPMQAAEGSFNTKYPHEPNGIKDPEYSIQCGVQELKAALTSAEVESPIDMEHIKLALQGYNFGNGYISWAKTKYGGYSYANAVEFSTQQAQRLGWDSYGDTQYPAHVLRYYPYGRAFTAGGNQAIVEVALTQLGNQGGQPYWSWYGFNSRVEWCACFVSWCADQCGYIESGLVPKFAGCVDGANWFKSNGKWQDRTYEPKVGDIIFFDWEGDGTTDHVGIVEKCENGTVYTVEGNSGDACKQRQYAVGSSNIYGYGIPAY